MQATNERSETATAAADPDGAATSRPSTPPTMRAIVVPRYGSPDVLETVELETPAATEGTVVVRVRAASVNAVDWHRMRGEPYFIRLTDGFRRPKEPRLGADVAGIVESVGAGVTSLRPGDEVFGMSLGTFAEFVRVKAEGLVPKPANVSLEAAAAVPVAATTALQGLRDKGALRAGQRLLVMGAGGGVGTFAVQLAKTLGAEVTAVTSSSAVDLVRALGADAVVDYTRDDVTRQGGRFDLVFDASGRRSLGDLRRVMKPTGVLVICGAGRGNWIGPLGRVAKGVAMSKLGSRTFSPFLAHRDHDDLATLAGLMESGAIVPVIERTYPFDEIREAIRHLETGSVHGKVAIRV